MVQHDTSLETLGNQGWFKVTWYLILIRDWRGLIDQFHPSTIALLHRQHKRAIAANQVKNHAQD